MTADYTFHTVWRVAGTVVEVADVLGDAAALPRWWPAVYLTAVVRRQGGADGVGAVVALHTKGWLPYTLRWTLTVAEPVTAEGFALTARGDLNGTGRWTFAQDGPEVEIGYDWRVSASKPLLRRLTWLLRPVFSANHHWAMARGEESLKLELRRRRGSAPGSVPLPPRPGPPSAEGVPRRDECSCENHDMDASTPAQAVLTHDLDGRSCLVVSDADGEALWTVDLPAETRTPEDAIEAAHTALAEAGISARPIEIEH